jgi:hypothetical protein
MSRENDDHAGATDRCPRRSVAEPMPRPDDIPGHRLLPRRERRAGARLLLWARVVTAMSGATASALIVVAMAGRLL